MSEKNGSCLCGSVKYTLTGEPFTRAVCHCSDCKKASGSSFQANLMFKKEDFKLTSGEDVLKTYNGTKSNSGASPGRVFCSNCGSNIMITPSSGDPIVIITSGCLDGEDGAKLGEGPQMELFCKRAEKWLDVKNESKKFQTMPGQ